MNHAFLNAAIKDLAKRRSMPDAPKTGKAEQMQLEFLEYLKKKSAKELANVKSKTATLNGKKTG